MNIYGEVPFTYKCTCTAGYTGDNCEAGNEFMNYTNYWTILWYPSDTEVTT